ncbi:MAG: hypothetical protein HHJ12_06675 [Glaciimonas sp.]|nr:hypothetical protein [Glaciimonas sp.]
MNNETDIQLSGPFTVTDTAGQTRKIQAIRIFDEGYGIIDVYVDFASSITGERLYKDTVLVRQVLARLRLLGYVGPDFGHGDLGLQDDKLIVLEAPEEFNTFAASKGWKNLAEEFSDEDSSEFSENHEADFSAGNSQTDSASKIQLDALMRKFKA